MTARIKEGYFFGTWFLIKEGLPMFGHGAFRVDDARASRRGAAALLACGMLAASGAPMVQAEFEDLLLEPVGEIAYPIADLPDIGTAAASGPVGNGFAVVPMIVDGASRPVVNVTIGGEKIPFLVDTGSRGTFVSLAEFAEGPNPLVSWLDSPLINWIPSVSDSIGTMSTMLNLVEKLGLPTTIFPQSGFGYGDGPSYTYLPFQVRDGIGFGNDLITGQQVSTGPTTVNVVISEYSVFDSRFWSDFANPNEEYISDYLFDSSARGIMGVGLEAAGRGPIVTTALPGDLGRGIVIDVPSRLLGLGIPPAYAFSPGYELAAGERWQPWADAYVSINGGDHVPVRAMYDSGGAFGSLSAALFGGSNAHLVQQVIDNNGNDLTRVAPNVTISVYNSFDNRLIYSFTTTQHSSTNVEPYSAGDPVEINTGAWPFLNNAIFFCTVADRCPEMSGF